MSKQFKQGGQVPLKEMTYRGKVYGLFGNGDCHICPFSSPNGLNCKIPRHNDDCIESLGLHWREIKLSPKIIYVKPRVIPIFRAFALPWKKKGVYDGIIIINERYRDDELLIKHESRHLYQIKRMTLPIYLMRYIVQLIFIGYDSMPMELEARQDDVSLWNYRERKWTKH